MSIGPVRALGPEGAAQSADANVRLGDPNPPQPWCLNIRRRTPIQEPDQIKKANTHGTSQQRTIDRKMLSRCSMTAR
jgi:hypothetical protein